MNVKRRLTARFVKRIVVVFILVLVFRMFWVSMSEVLYSDPTTTTNFNDDDNGNRKVRGVQKITVRDNLKNVHVESRKQLSTTTATPKVDICQKVVPFRSVSPSTISTFDLPDVADYGLDENRNYKLPAEVYNRSERPLTEEVKVIIVPFSHADPGYGLTVEDYYLSHTRSVLTLMIEKLTQYPNMTFQWVETVFLERWYRDITDRQKQQVRELIKRGQLEIVLGGWVMPDEAVTRYTSVVDQLIEGHQWLKENLGVVPENAWVNDPFGFSSTMPYLWKSSGMDNLVILRIHQAIKATLMKSRSLEFMWRPYWRRDSRADILTNIMPYTNYWASDVCGPVQEVCRRFNFLHMEQDTHFVSHVTNANIEQLAESMYKSYKLTSGIYEYNNLIIFLGEDNSYSRDRAWDDTYLNYVKLMDYINNRPDWKMNVKFGTMKEYFANVREEEAGKRSALGTFNVHPKFPVLSGDFFPYSDREHAYWTGYYTTRPWVKKLSREVEPVLKAADVFSVMLYHICFLQKGFVDIRNQFRQTLDNLRTARRELGIYQHHDGITGTSVPYVVLDYETRLMSALEKAQQALKMAVVSLLSQGKISNPAILQESYEKLDSKSIRADRLYYLKNGRLDIIATNPLEKSRTEIISILVNYKNVDVLVGNKTIYHQMLQIQHSVVPRKLGYLLSFRVKLAPFEIQTAVVQETTRENTQVYTDQRMDDISNGASVTISTKRLKVTVDIKTCQLRSITDSKGRTTQISSQFMKYSSQASGAYLFGPAGPAEEIPGVYNTVRVYVTKGPLVSEINCFFDNAFSQRFRLYDTSGSQGQGLHISNVIDLQKSVYPTDNIEVILRFHSDVQNENIFFTDQNSFQLMGRKTYPERQIESNYYPISSMALVEDSKKRLTLHSAQPNGVASLENGWLEVMLDRNMPTDDGRGLGQGVYDKVGTLSEFVLQVEYKATESSLGEERYNHPTLYNTLVGDLFLNPIQIFALTNTENNGDNTDNSRRNQNIDFNNVPNNHGLNNVNNMIVNKHESIRNNDHVTFQEQFQPRYIPGSPEIQLPCDTNIVNLKLLVTNELGVLGTSVVLHRTPIHCLFSHQIKRCRSQTGAVTPSNLLNVLGVGSQTASRTKLTETTLSHLHVKDELSNQSDLRPEVSELRTFLVKHTVY